MEFLNPNVFYIMMIPLIVLFVLLRTSKNGLEQYFSKEILAQLKVENSFLSKKSRNTLYFIILVLFIIALARPVTNQKEHNVKQNLIPIVIALDVSKSMLVEDIYPNRISMAKKKLQRIIEKSKNTTIGIVLFAKDSFILSPVTEDFISLKYIVDNLNTQVDFVNGSNVFATLEATKYMLDDFKVKNLIVLSDGGNENNYEDELSFAKENEIVIYSIGLGTKNGAPIPLENGYVTDKSGNIVTLKLNESIKNLSLKSGGGYIDFTLDDNDIDAILNRINIQSKKEELSVQKVRTYTELFYYPLGLGLLFLLFALSSLPNLKKIKSLKSLAIVSYIATCVLFPQASQAITFNFENIEKATKAYENKEYKIASDNYRQVTANSQSFYNLGNALYKQEKYEDAIKAYNKVVTNDKNLESQKLYNLGNSYVKTNNLSKAKELYEKALKISDDKQTKENLDAVNKELEKQKQKQKEQKNKKDEGLKKQDQEKKDDTKEDKKNQNQEKNKKENQEKKKQEEKNKKSNNEKQKEDKENQKQKDMDKAEKQKAEETTSDDKKENQISQMEEKKWMKMLQNQKTPLYLQKVNTKKESSNDEEQPW